MTYKYLANTIECITEMPEIFPENIRIDAQDILMMLASNIKVPEYKSKKLFDFIRELSEAYEKHGDSELANLLMEKCIEPEIPASRKLLKPAFDLQAYKNMD